MFFAQFFHAQIHQQEEILTQLQQRMKCDEEHHSELTKQLQSTNKTVVELQNEVEAYRRLDRESSARVRELEASVSRLGEDLDAAEQRARMMGDELMEKDGQLRVTTMNLETANKQNKIQMSQVVHSWLIV